MSQMENHHHSDHKPQQIQQIHRVLTPYIKKTIKAGMLLARNPQNHESSPVYKKISLWFDDISRLIHLTSSFSKAYLTNQNNPHLKENIQQTHRQLITALNHFNHCLKSNESQEAQQQIIKNHILPTLIQYKNRLLPKIKMVIDHIENNESHSLAPQ